MKDFQHAVEGPIISVPIMHQIYESLYRLRNLFPIGFEFRVYMTRELIERILGQLTTYVNFETKGYDYKIYDCLVVPTEGEGARWWIGVPGFVVPKGGDCDE